MVVEQHHVIFLGAVHFARLARAAIHGVVTTQGLARAHRRQHRQEQRQVLEPRQHLLDAHQRDHRPRQRRRQAGVTFVLRDGQHPDLGDGEVGAGDANVGLEVLLAEHPAGDHRQLFRIVGRCVAQLALEHVLDLIARQVHRREHDVIRRLLAKLHDELAQV